MTPVNEMAAVIGAPLFLQEVGGTDSPSAVIVRWRYSDADFNIAPSNFVRVTISLQNEIALHHQTGDAVSFAHFAKVGSVWVEPAHTPFQISVKGPNDVLQIFLRESFLESSIDGPFDCVALLNSHNSEIRAAAFQLLVASTRGDPDDALLRESGVHRLGGLLMNLGPEASGPTRGGLTRSAHRRVEDMITAALDDTNVRSPTLDELADAARLSVNHFIRAFRQQTGVTPHRHVVRRRLERGIALLRSPGMTVARVSHEAGFATSAHFIATFRRTMGVTPGAFQAAILG